ncbi:hypothetical protein C8Q77DRAFT_846668 [Trametes polyzona]|nr:hypothetical protein C8Q77DRAFT_846668 [Trametes polyzona]
MTLGDSEVRLVCAGEGHIRTRRGRGRGLDSETVLVLRLRSLNLPFLPSPPPSHSEPSSITPASHHIHGRVLHYRISCSGRGALRGRLRRLRRRRHRRKQGLLHHRMRPSSHDPSCSPVAWHRRLQVVRIRPVLRASPIMHHLPLTTTTTTTTTNPIFRIITVHDTCFTTHAFAHDLSTFDIRPSASPFPSPFPRPSGPAPFRRLRSRRPTYPGRAR